MKKTIFTMFAALLSSAMFAQTELVDFSKISVESWGGSGNPEVSIDVDARTITAVIIGTPGWQWGNQVKITLTNVTELSKEKEYKLSFTAIASTDDCSGVTLKWFDNNQLFYTDENYLVFSTTAYNYESEYLSLEEDATTATNGTIVLDFGWDPVQIITISNLSFLEKAKSATALDNLNTADKAQKRIVDGQLVIEKDGMLYNVMGAPVK